MPAMMAHDMPRRAALPPRVGRYTSEEVSKEIQRLIDMSERGTHNALAIHLGFGHSSALTKRLQGDGQWLIEHLGATFDFFADLGFALPDGWPLVKYRGPRPPPHDSGTR